jgi:hypothetical protein
VHALAAKLPCSTLKAIQRMLCISIALLESPLPLPLLKYSPVVEVQPVAVGLARKPLHLAQVEAPAAGE